MSEIAALKMTTTLTPIDKNGLDALAQKGKANPQNIVTLKIKTVCESKFRNLNFVRNLPAHVIDEPPYLLGDDTAPNPSEAALATLGSCLSVGLHANAVARGITLSKIELELEGDINVTAVWHLSKLCGAAMTAKGSGAIVNIASMLGFVSGTPLKQICAVFAHD